MNALATAKEALLEACKPIDAGSVIIVPTPFTFPDGGPVRVTLVPHQEGKIILSDAGETIRNYLLWGGEPELISKGFKKKVSLLGLRTDETLAVLSPPVPAQNVSLWIGIIGQAAVELAEWLSERHARETAISLKKLLDAHFSRHFGKRLKRDAELQGASGKVHKFHWLIKGNKNEIVVDAVTPDGSAIYAAFGKHLDLSLSDYQCIANRIIYDPEEKWRPGDLNLLQEAAPLINYQNAIEEIERLAA